MKRNGKHANNHQNGNGVISTEEFRTFCEGGRTVKEFFEHRGIEGSHTYRDRIAREFGIPTMYERGVAWWARRFGAPELASKAKLLEAIEKAGNMHNAADSLGLPFNQLFRLWVKHGLKKKRNFRR